MVSCKRVAQVKNSSNQKFPRIRVYRVFDGNIILSKYKLTEPENVSGVSILKVPIIFPRVNLI